MYDNFYYNDYYYYFYKNSNMVIYQNVTKRIALILLIEAMLSKKVNIRTKRGKGNFKNKNLKYIEYNPKLIYISKEPISFVDNLNNIGGKEKNVELKAFPKTILNNIVFKKLLNEVNNDNINEDWFYYYLNKLKNENF